MIKKKNKYDVTTVAKCLTDNAVDDKGAVAFNTFMTEDKEYSNDYIIPFHAICEAKVKLSQEDVEVDDPTCQSGDVPPTPGEPRIDGANNTSMNQGTDFDLTAGVKAYDGEGNEIPFTVTPNEVDKCEVGQQTFTYSAEGVTKERTITVKQIANPTITGLEQLTVEVGEEFDPLDGVEGTDGNGNEVEVTYGASADIVALKVTNISIDAHGSVPYTNEVESDWRALYSEGYQLYATADRVVVTANGGEYDDELVSEVANWGDSLLVYLRNTVGYVYASFSESGLVTVGHEDGEAPVPDAIRFENLLVVARKGE